MAYIGQDLSYANIYSEQFSGSGGTDFTLAYTVPTASSIAVFISGVHQVADVDYNIVTGGSVLRFTTIPPTATNNISVHGLGRTVDIGEPADGTVSLAKMQANSVDSSQLVAGSVDLAHLSATGTPSASLALKGDYSWGTAGGPSLGSGNECVRTNSDEINQNITVPSGTNASSIGPVTVGSSYAVTVNGVYTVI